MKSIVFAARSRSITWAVAFCAVACMVVLMVPLCAFADDSAGLAITTQGEKGLNITGKANTELLYDTASCDGPEESPFLATIGWYDITGDSWADEIELDMGPQESSESDELPLYIKVNGKLAKTYAFGNWYTVSILTLKNGTPFLSVSGGVDAGGTITRICQFSKGKLINVCKGSALLAGTQGVSLADPATVAGNTLTVTHQLNTKAVGLIDVKYAYVYKKGSMVRKSNTTSSVKYYNATGAKFGKPWVKSSKAFKVYTSTTLKKKAFAVKKGQKIKLTACNSHGGKLYLKVSNSKKSGWIKAFTTTKAKAANLKGKPVLPGRYS